MIVYVPKVLAVQLAVAMSMLTLAQPAIICAKAVKVGLIARRRNDSLVTTRLQ